MPFAWSGGDPNPVADTEDYELGIAWRAEDDLTLTHARIYTPLGELTVSPRRFRVWSSTGSLIHSELIPDDLTTGWALIELAAPVPILATTVFVTSYNTGGNYGALANALDSDVVSLDGKVTALAAVNSPDGHNGRFNATPGSFPNQGAGSHPFYGVDFEYIVGIGGNTAPDITGAQIQITGAHVTVTIVAEDAETLSGASYGVDWGDGSSPTIGASPALSHTYLASGQYSILLSVTDAGGLSDYVARTIRVQVPGTAPLRPTYLFPDAEALVLDYLRPLIAARPEPWLTGLVLGNKRPDTSIPMPPSRVLYVRRIGGQQRTEHLDLARIDFNCYGRDEAESADLARLVYALMKASVNHSGITTVTPFLGLTNAPDDRGNLPRYMFTLEFQIKGEAL